MDTMDADTAAQTPHAETEAALRDRIAWEAEGIAEARAQLNAGLYVDGDEVRAWVISLRTDTPLPPPRTRRFAPAAGACSTKWIRTPDATRPLAT